MGAYHDLISSGRKWPLPLPASSQPHLGQPLRNWTPGWRDDLKPDQLKGPHFSWKKRFESNPRSCHCSVSLFGFHTQPFQRLEEPLVTWPAANVACGDAGSAEDQQEPNDLRLPPELG